MWKNNSDKNLHICFAADNAYAPHLCAAIFSLLKNISPDFFVNIYILDGWITEENVKKITHSLDIFSRFHISFISFNRDQYKKYPSIIGLAAYYRLEIAHLFPNISRMLYIDSDVIVTGDVSKIFSYDIEKSYFWAISEITLRAYYKDRLWLDQDGIFFNSWVLFLNLEKIRQENFFEKAKQYILVNSEILFDSDQQAMNVIWEKKWLPLPPKYNSLPWNFYTNSYKNLGYTQKDFLDAQKKPCIIHFAWEKPWKYFCDHPKKDIYWEYRNQTMFSCMQKTPIDNFSFRGLWRFIVNKIFMFLMIHLSEKSYFYLIYIPAKKLRNFLKKIH